MRGTCARLVFLVATLAVALVCVRAQMDNGDLGPTPSPDLHVNGVTDPNGQHVSTSGELTHTNTGDGTTLQNSGLTGTDNNGHETLPSNNKEGQSHTDTGGDVTQNKKMPIQGNDDKGWDGG